jgi:hypothetical protein
MNAQSVEILHIPSFPCKRESSFFKHIFDPWIPAFAGMTTSYETIKPDNKECRLQSEGSEKRNCEWINAVSIGG